jgi:outer membrane receptor for ferrienterochelin and colicin
MRFARVFLCVAASLVLAVPILAQIASGTLSGHVTDGKTPLPGATVKVTAVTLQGPRTTVTGANGDYLFRFLPPGEYKVWFELQGFETQETTVKVNSAQTQQLDATMPQAKVAEEVTVTGTYETVSTALTGATTIEYKTVDKLPLARTIQNYLSLAPGVHSTGPSGNWSISGAQSYENLYLINGVVVNENLRGQPVDTYIEDAVQETTTSVSGISAEYGRFAGGVVNVLTKSGGNELHASLRDTMTSDKWTLPTPLTPQRNDTINKTYEATVGGFIMQDRLWYFLAGRKADTIANYATYTTRIPVTQGLSDQRWEGKLTWSITPNHRIVGDFLDRKRNWTNYWFSNGSVDLTQVYDRSIPERLISGNYNGVLSNNFFIEAQYSERTLTFVGSGGRYTDMIKGTPIIDRATGAQGNSPTFCGVCEEEKRNNKDYLVKLSYFVSTKSMGSHDIVFGGDSYSDYHLSMNHQSGSDWQLRVPSFIYTGSFPSISWYPKVATATTGASATTLIYWWPILATSQGSNFKVNSVFINDRWRFSNNFSFNLGVRYDKNDATNAWGKTASKDSKLSPRLGLTWDPKGNGEWTVTAGYANYVTSLANTGNVGDASPAGNPAAVVWGYTGPAINTGAAPYVDPATALQQVLNWFNTTYCDANGNCGAKNLTNVRTYSFPGYNSIIQGSLRSPYAEEWTVGANKRLGTRGLARIDWVHREFKDLYQTVTAGPGSSGKVPINLLGLSTTVDLSYIQNSNFLTRKYDGVDLQGEYRLDRWQFGAMYTWSHAYGNLDGETAGSGPVTGTNPFGYYPEYRQQAWNVPSRDLGIDQRHRARLWLVWDVIAATHNRVSVSVLENYNSGSPYGASGAVRSYLYVTNPGYISPPTTAGYWYTSPMAFHTANVTSTDLSLNYAFTFKAAGKDFEIYVIPQVLNLFNEKAVVAPDSTVYDATTSSTFANFNPFTTTPKECAQGTAAADCTAMGANWQKGPNFGKPMTSTNLTTAGAWQLPRTIRISVGIRF